MPLFRRYPAAILAAILPLFPKRKLRGCRYSAAILAAIPTAIIGVTAEWLRPPVYATCIVRCKWPDIFVIAPRPGPGELVRFEHGC